MMQDLTAHYLRISELFQSIDIDDALSNQMRELLLRQIKDTAELLLAPPPPIGVALGNIVRNPDGFTRESLREAITKLGLDEKLELTLADLAMAQSVLTNINQGNQKIFDPTRYGRRVEGNKLYVVRNR